MRTPLEVGDKKVGSCEGKGLAGAPFSIWLGSTPPSADFKSGMQG